MKNLKSNIFFTLLILNCSYSFGLEVQDIPSEFQSFYNEEIKQVNVEFPEGDIENILMSVSYNTIRIDSSNRKLQDVFYRMLIRHNVKPEIASQFVQELSTPKGLTSSNKCKGFLNTCIVLTDKYDLVYDPDRNTLRLFFSHDVLNKNEGTPEYASSVNFSPALINSTSLFVNSSDDNMIISLSDSLIQGFKYGYLDSKFYLTSSNNSRLDKLSYNFEQENMRYSIGYFSDDNSMNSTDVIESFTNSDVVEFSVGNSKNLLLKTSDINKKIQIYVPAAGLLSIKKDGNYIKQYAVKAGQNNILYSNLPYGVYEIDVTVKSGNNIIFNKKYNVYNTRSDQLSSGDIDYRIQAGILKDNNDDFSGKFDDNEWKDYDDSAYFSTKITYGINDALMIGGALSYSDNNSVYQISGNYLLMNSDSIRASSKIYSGGSYQYDATIYSSYLNFGLSAFKLNSDDDFAAFTEDNESYTNINISRMFALDLNSTIGIYYNLSKLDNAKSHDLTSNYTYMINGNSRVDFQVNYNKTDDERFGDDETFEFRLAYNHDFDSGGSARTSISTDTDSYNEFSLEYDTGDLINDDNTSLALTGRTEVRSNNRERDAVSSLDINGLYANEHFTSGYYGSLNSTGNNNLSLNLSSSQIISDSGLTITNKKSDAYLELDVHKSKDINEKMSYGTLALLKDDKVRSDITISEKDKLIGLSRYSLYKSKIDTLSSSIENNGSKGLNLYSHPGTVGQIKLDLTKIVSFVGSYSDIFEQEIVNLGCEGEGCVDIEKIDQNVFRVAVHSGKEFVLKSSDNNYVCLTPQVRNVEVLNIGKSYCVPETDEEFPIVLKNPATGESMNLVYLGIFKDENKWKYASLLDNERYRLIEKEFGNGNNLVYVNIPDSENVSNIALSQLSDLMKTADIPRNDIYKYVLLLSDEWN